LKDTATSLFRVQDALRFNSEFSVYRLTSKLLIPKTAHLVFTTVKVSHLVCYVSCLVKARTSVPQCKEITNPEAVWEYCAGNKNGIQRQKVNESWSVLYSEELLGTFSR